MRTGTDPRTVETAVPAGSTLPKRLSPLPIVVGRVAWLGTLALVAGGSFAWAQLGFRDLPVSLNGGAIASLALPVIAIVYASIGALIVEQRRGYVMGGLFLAVGLVIATVLPVDVLVGESHSVMRPVPTTTLILAWLESAVSLPVVATLVLVIPVLFPTGRPIGRRWWAAIVAGVAGGSLLAAAGALCPAGLMWYPSLPNPFATRGIEPILYAVSASGVTLILGAILAAVASIVIRYRRADGVLRCQLRWATLGAILTGLTASPAVIVRYVPGSAGFEGAEALMTIAILGQVFAPCSVGVAILRHHLYDVDVLIDRSLVYLPMIGLLGGLYAASVALVQRVFVALTGDTSDLAIIVSSLLIAWVFTPLRKYLEGVVERRLHPRAPAREAEAASPAVALPSEIGALEAELHTVESRLAALEATRREGSLDVILPGRRAQGRRRAVAAPLLS